MWVVAGSSLAASQCAAAGALARYFLSRNNRATGRSSGFTPASRHVSARLIAECKRRHLRTHSKMKELMALAAGLPTIFQDRGGRRTAGVKFIGLRSEQKQEFQKITQGPVIEWLKTQIGAPGLIDEALSAAQAAR